MTPTLNGQTAIIRTERGLVIAGTRITLYDVMDFIAIVVLIDSLRLYLILMTTEGQGGFLFRNRFQY